MSKTTLFSSNYLLKQPDRLLMLASLIDNVKSALIEEVCKNYPPLGLLRPIIEDERCAHPWITLTHEMVNPL